MSSHKHHRLSKAKARKMLHEGRARGHKITSRQRRFFGLIASGKRPTRVRSKKR